MKLYFTQIDPPGPGAFLQLKARGWSCGSLSMRESQEQEPEPWRPDAYRAIILTSTRACSWLMARHDLSQLPPLAVVGNHSRAKLKGARFLLPADQPAPANAGELTDAIFPLLKPEDRLLWLRGEEAGKNLHFEPGQLDQRIVYATRHCRTLPDPPDPKSMVYFQSPSAVSDYFANFPQPFRIAAIGPATAKALAQIGWAVDFMPSRPETAVFARELPVPSKFLNR